MQTELPTVPVASPARVLVVGDSPELTTAALEVEAIGHHVQRASRLSSALGIASSESPEVVLVESSNGFERETLIFCAELREIATIARPAVIMLERAPVTEVMRKDAWRAGVWHIMEAPVDAEELALRIDLVLSVRRDAERAHSLSLVDAETGLYNATGLARRTRELSAEAMRTHKALACVVISASVEGEAATRTAAARSAEVLRTLGRVSDIVGRVGPLEYVVLAPATTAKGAARLARRLAVAYRVALIHALPGVRAHTEAGYCSMANLAYAPHECADILTRASTALKVGRGAPHFEWLSPTELDPRAPVA